MKTINYQSEIEIREEYDVVVAGAGPAGIGAAVSAAREGVRTAVVERSGVVGGNLTCGLVGPIMGSVSEGTIAEEIRGLLNMGDPKTNRGCNYVHSAEDAKLTLLELLRRESVDVYLQTELWDVIMEGTDLRGLLLSHSSGRFGILGKVVIDATGNGDAAVLAGADFAMGREGDSLLQPVSIMYIIDQVDPDCDFTCHGEEDETTYQGERFFDFTEKCVKAGILPPNTSSVRLYRTMVPGERLVNTTQVNGINPLSIPEMIEAEIELRKQIEPINQFLRTYVAGFEHCRTKVTSSTLGIRESRRIMGEYVLTLEDLRAGKRFEDVMVHQANFVIDIHNPSGGGQAQGIAEKVRSYDIPYRCLIPRRVENLLLAGRCISGTHEAHASYRVMNICMAMGEAVGAAAALSVKNGVTPRKQDVGEIQKILRDRGIQLE